LKVSHIIGLLLWRGGLVTVAAVLLYESVSWLLRFVDLPVQLGVGIGLVGTGVLLVLASLIAERVREYRTEGESLRD
jgi:hypothetical protein